MRAAVSQLVRLHGLMLRQGDNFVRYEIMNKGMFLWLGVIIRQRACRTTQIIGLSHHSSYTSDILVQACLQFWYNSCIDHDNSEFNVTQIYTHVTKTYNRCESSGMKNLWNFIKVGIIVRGVRQERKQTVSRIVYEDDFPLWNQSLNIQHTVCFSVFCRFLWMIFVVISSSRSAALSPILTL